MVVLERLHRLQIQARDAVFEFISLRAKIVSGHPGMSPPSFDLLAASGASGSVDLGVHYGGAWIIASSGRHSVEATAVAPICIHCPIRQTWEAEASVLVLLLYPSRVA